MFSAAQMMKDMIERSWGLGVKRRVMRMLGSEVTLDIETLTEYSGQGVCNFLRL